MDWIFHIDNHLLELIHAYHGWIYAILALIIFCETGLVATPFLPGDSLLFAAGALFAKSDALNLPLLMISLSLAALMGDNVNYYLGKRFGVRLFKFKFLSANHLEKTSLFYEKNGGKTIIIARFLPIIRTFAPFVAGIARMSYKRYMIFCIAGALLWVTSLTTAGYYLGSLPFIKNNFEVIVLLMIALSSLPALLGFLSARFQKN